MLKTYDPKIHKRRSIRLPAFDYTEPGFYFVTICANGKKCVFGDVVDEKMVLNEWGNVIKEELLKTEQIRKNVHITTWVVMPNHIHFIAEVTCRGTPVACPGKATNTIQATNAPVACPGKATGFADTWGTPSACPYDGHLRKFGGSEPNTISSIVSQFKSIVTKRIRAMIGQPVDVWQRNYYERIIQTDEALFDTIEYIRNNPKDWGKDGMNA